MRSLGVLIAEEKDMVLGRLVAQLDSLGHRVLGIARDGRTVWIRDEYRHSLPAAAYGIVALAAALAYTLLVRTLIRANGVDSAVARAIGSDTKGYASLNYEFLEYRRADVVRLDILVAEEPVEALASIVYLVRVQLRGKS